MRRCDVLAQCSEDPDRITRRFLSPPMRHAHDHLSGWMQALGMTTRVDDAGNLIAHRAAAEEAKTLIIGSHIDTVPGAGRYDGVLGVVAALSVVEALGDTPLPFHIDVIGFSEEEGVRFGEPYLGSSAVAGCFSPEWLTRCDNDGVTIGEAITLFGGSLSRLPQCAYKTNDVLGYIEPHLEQGPVLERMARPVAVVSAIAGQSRLVLRFTGEEGHAGTTPIEGRRDALVAAAEFVGLVRRVGSTVEDLRATVGRLQVAPGAANVIPCEVTLSLDVRHALDSVRKSALEQMLAGAEEIASREACEFKVVRSTDQAAIQVDDALTEVLAAAADETSGATPRLPSGAGHDAVVMARRFPVAMLFLRHPGGVSHSPEERVDESDVAVGIEVLTRAVRRLAEGLTTSGHTQA